MRQQHQQQHRGDLVALLAEGLISFQSYFFFQKPISSVFIFSDNIMQTPRRPTLQRFGEHRHVAEVALGEGQGLQRAQAVEGRQR